MLEHFFLCPTRNIKYCTFVFVSIERHREVHKQLLEWICGRMMEVLKFFPQLSNLQIHQLCTKIVLIIFLQCSFLICFYFRLIIHILLSENEKISLGYHYSLQIGIEVDLLKCGSPKMYKLTHHLSRLLEYSSTRL